MRTLLALFFIFGLNVYAQNSKAPSTAENLPKYQIGSGGKYQLMVGKDPTDVQIGFVEQTPSKLVVEISMKSANDKDSLNIKMVQQFQLGVGGGKIKIQKGIMKIPMISQPQILPPEYLEGFDGAQVKSFLIGSSSELSGKKVGIEHISTPAGDFTATHYRHIENGQTIDYWIADAAKPLGLVKIESTGKSSSQNYKMEFKGTVTGVTAQINADEAVPLNEAAKAFLPLLLPGANRL
jgi:hypothetical protein